VGWDGGGGSIRPDRTGVLLNLYRYQIVTKTSKFDKFVSEYFPTSKVERKVTKVAFVVDWRAPFPEKLARCILDIGAQYDATGQPMCMFL